MPLADPIAWYERHAAQVASAYEALPPGRLHSWLNGLLPTAPALVLDIGAVTGRDAAWFADLGHDVVAVEPAAAMRAEAARLPSVNKGDACISVSRGSGARGPGVTSIDAPLTRSQPP